MSNETTARNYISINESKARKPDMVKKIGKTTYTVNVHFNQNARETMSEKIKRMLRNEVRQNAKL